MAVSSSASERRCFSAAQQKVFRTFGLSLQQISGIVIDSDMTREQAIGSDQIVPADALKNHRLIKPDLAVVPLVYWGYDGRVHLGQMVVHCYMVSKVVSLFLVMWRTGFPVQSVIPASKFKNDDTDSMRANNSTGYRTELRSEHGKGSAMDLNPFTNPFDTSAYNGNPVEPLGAYYDPTTKGALVMGGPVQEAAANLSLEWGGNWGNPNAVPQSDFFAGHPGFFDWQHFQLSDREYDIFEAQLPSGFQS